MPLTATKSKMSISSVKEMVKVTGLLIIVKGLHEMSMHAKYEVSIFNSSKSIYGQDLSFFVPQTGQKLDDQKFNSRGEGGGG